MFRTDIRVNRQKRFLYWTRFVQRILFFSCDPPRVWLCMRIKHFKIRIRYITIYNIYTHTSILLCIFWLRYYDLFAVTSVQKNAKPPFSPWQTCLKRIRIQYARRTYPNQIVTKGNIARVAALVYLIRILKCLPNLSLHLCVLHCNEIFSLFLKIYRKPPSQWTHANSVSNFYWNTIIYYAYLLDIKYLEFCMFYGWKKNRPNDLCNGLLNEAVSKSYCSTFVRNENNIWNYCCVLKTEKVNEKFHRNINGKEKIKAQEQRNLQSRSLHFWRSREKLGKSKFGEWKK